MPLGPTTDDDGLTTTPYHHGAAAPPTTTDHAPASSLPARLLRQLSSSLLASGGSSPSSAAGATANPRPGSSAPSSSASSLRSFSSASAPPPTGDDQLQQQQQPDYHPPRTHWRPDADAKACAECGSAFSLVRRVHHCRKCGDVFCGRCSAYQARLDDALQPSESAAPVRVCRTCFRAADRADPDAVKRDVDRLREHKRRIDALRAAETGAPGAPGAMLPPPPPPVPQPTATTTTPAVMAGDDLFALPMDAPARPTTDDEADAASNTTTTGDGKKAIVLGSVPSNWTWSTF
ncbi:hypothetical protein BC828DRAFT_351973 [Blastocladiella britannica]|nr:hypothetical protein BC828DRAFT_351973 [Blastocladiella britannica]